MRRIAAAMALLWLTAVIAAGVAQAASVTIEQVAYKGWADAYRLSNGTVDMVVVPSVGGRVMRYGYIGGPNVFWENPTAAGKPIPFGTWPNTGGDKIWPWSQDDWPALIGRGFPPPPAADQAPHQAEIVAPDTLRLTSSRVVPWGFRIVRDIRLAPSGTQVYTSSRFVQEGGKGSTLPVGVWAITQVPATPLIFVRLMPQAAQLENSVKPMGTVSFTLTRPVANIMQAARFPGESGKFGTDADLLASMVSDDTLLTLRFDNPPADNAGAAYQPGERVQVYNQPDDADALRNGITAYNELELTSPRKTLKPGDTLTLNVVWELRRLPENKRTPAEIAALLSSLP